MNTTASFRNNAWNNFNWLLAGLALALAPPARAATPPAAIPFSTVGARATANYQGDALGVTATSDGARLRCGFQKLEGHATSEGLCLESTAPGAAGRLRFTASAIGRDSSRARECALTEPDVLELIAPTDVGAYTALATSGNVSVNGNLVRFTRPGLTEEYSVSVDGVRQDFIIESPPLNPPLSTLNPQSSTLNHSAGDLRVELALSGARAEATASGARLRLDGSGRTLAYSRLRVEDATGRELTARLEVLSADRLAVSVADAKATYPVRIDPAITDGGGMNNGVLALAVGGTNLYAGGWFTTAGGVSANYIAKWDGSAWSSLGSGLNGYVYALAVSGTNLYAGGWFNYIAKWDGSAWSALGSGLGGGADPYVYALAVSGTNLYAGGDFTTAGGMAATNIAKWDGHAWSALGWGMNDFVSALAVSGTNLYAGGLYDGVVAKWDGSTWSALGEPRGQVLALAASGSRLYAGETSGNGVLAPVDSWDGSAWSALGGFGFDPYLPRQPMVCALAVSGADLYAGGAFTSGSGGSANYIAKWDGSTWSALGSGMNNQVYALAADGAGHLFIGGLFTSPGNYIAQVGISLPLPTILTPPQSQTAEDGAGISFAADATGYPPLTYQWLFNGKLLAGCTNSVLCLSGVQPTNVGAYAVVVGDSAGAVTSSPAMLNVIAPVARRTVPGVKLAGQSGSPVNVDYATALNPMPAWNPLGSVSLTSPPQFYFDLTAPLPPHRFYRAWQTTPPSQPPTLDLHLVPAITLTGTIGSSVRVDYINRLGPIDAWVTLATVTLSNTSQLYFDVSAPGQPQRLYRLVQVP